MSRATVAAAVAAVSSIMAWTWTVTGVTAASDPHSVSTHPSWSSRAWNVYQRYYRETASATTEKANKGGGHWGRLLGMIADDRYQKKDDGISVSSTAGGMCQSPFGIDDKDRIALCFGEDSVVMASYLSDVEFATSILSTLNALGNDDDLPLFDDHVSQHGLFEFIVHHHYDKAATAATLDNDNLSVPEEDAIIVNGSMQTSAIDPSSGPPDTSSNTSDAALLNQTETLNEIDAEAPTLTSESALSATNSNSSSINDKDSNATATAPQNTSKAGINKMDGNQILRTMLKCIGSSSDDVHDFISSSFSQPDGLQEDSLGNLCSVCMQEVQEMLSADNAAASDSLANTYAGGSSNAYLQLYCTDTSGGEGGNLLLTAGGGHDGQAGPSDTFGSGGGAGIQVQAQPAKGSEFAFETFSACNGGGCGLGTHMAGENLDEEAIVTQDSYCNLDDFVTGLALVKAEVRKCILDSETELQLTSGGNSNGFIGDTSDYTAQYKYTTSFRFEIGPNQL